MISKDAFFTPGSAVPGSWGTQTIYPGITLATSIGGQTPLFSGIATSAQTLVGFSANAFMLTGNNTSTTGTLSVLNNTGLLVGTNSDFRASVSGTQVTLANQTLNGNLVLGVNVGGTPTPAITINGSTGAVSIPTLSIQSFGDITVNNILNGLGNLQGNIGNATTYFNTVFAKSTSAQYADVAERFAIDEEQPAGTVVELGGPAEITCSTVELSDKVFGVISTHPAHLMNSGAGNDKTHPPIAMTGRVPVRATGIVNKGDRLVSAGNGLARSAKPGESTWSNTIGRALENKYNTDEGMVEAIVTIK